MGMSREQWLVERKKGVGASEAAAVLGISPWASPADVWARKRGLIPEQEENERLRTGRLFEEPIAQLYAEREKVQLVGGGDRQYDMIWHPAGIPVFATPDRLVLGADRGLEIKTVEPRMAHLWGEEGTDAIPPYYVTQVAVCMAVSGRGEWDVAAWFGLNDFRVYRLVRDRDLEEAIISRLTEWWRRYVVIGEEPEIDGSKAYADYLVQKFPQNRTPLLGANEETEKLLSDLFAIRDQVKADELIETEIENKLKAAIGDAEGIQGICGKVTWRLSRDGTKTDWQEVARMIYDASAAHITWDKTFEDYAKEFTTVKPGSRRFLPTPAK